VVVDVVVESEISSESDCVVVLLLYTIYTREEKFLLFLLSFLVSLVVFVCLFVCFGWGGRKDNNKPNHQHVSDKKRGRGKKGAKMMTT